MSNKIIIAALTATFGEKATQIAELCQRAPNPTYEIEMLLGVYELPVLAPTALFRYADNVYNLISYNPTTNPEYSVNCMESGTVTRFFKDEEHFAKRTIGYEGAGEYRKSDSYPLEKTFDFHNEKIVSLSDWIQYSINE
jgi:hypothetical protein